MRHHLQYSIYLGILLIVACNAPASNNTILKGATVFDGNGKTLENATLVIEDGKILAISSGKTKIPKGSSRQKPTPGLTLGQTHILFKRFGFVK